MSILVNHRPKTSIFYATEVEGLIKKKKARMVFKEGI